MTFPSSLPIPDEVLEIARTLEGAGHETWCVGGALRDELLGYAHADYDLATAATPAQVQSLFKRTAPVGEKYGTVGVIDRRRVVHEVTTFRRDVATDGRHAVVRYGVSLDDDLARRDFTINAIAYHPLRNEWRDPFQGEMDLRRRVVRAVGDPAQRFREDYLRILRAIRFAARFRFAVDDATWAAMVHGAEGLPRLSAERVRDEWFKGLATAESIEELVRLWRESGAAALLMPELDRVSTEALGQAGAVDRGRRDPVLLTVLLVPSAADLLRRLKASNAEIDRAASLASAPPGQKEPSRSVVGSPPSARPPTISSHSGLCVTDRNRLGPLPSRQIRDRGDPLTRGDLAIGGSDLQDLGLKGPRIGETLATLLDRVLEDPGRNNRETLMALARDMV